MRLLPHWKVITIGDGDLSFSLALARRYPELKLWATVLDSQQELRGKYELNAIDALQAAGHKVLFGVDITRPETFSQLAVDFDVAVFQFPLVPNAGPRKPGQSWHQSDDSNLQNRKLLHAFLNHSASCLLAPKGAGLCYITSKDVKPYCDWNIEGLAATSKTTSDNKRQTVMHYMGKIPFNPNEYPGYRVRNVDRDKQVKSTAASTYIWKLPHSVLNNTDLPEALISPKPELPRYCPLCDIGPIETEQDWLNHLNSRQHKRREKYQKRWEEYLANTTI